MATTYFYYEKKEKDELYFFKVAIQQDANINVMNVGHPLVYESKKEFVADNTREFYIKVLMTAFALFLLHFYSLKRMAYNDQIVLLNKTLREKNNQLNKAIKEIQTLNEELKEMSIRDSLTKVLNRSGYEEIMRSEWQRAKQTGTPISILLLDVDNFKTYNDTYGHLAGDEILKKVAQTIQESVRAMDIVGRFGGEEFILILPATSLAESKETAETIRSRIEARKILHRLSKNSGYLTVSIGGACTIPKESDYNVEKLIYEADMALYHAKRTGRNKVIISTATSKCSAV